MPQKVSTLYQSKAVVTAVLTYFGVALATGWILSPVLAGAPNFTRIAFVAVTTTIAGMIASRWLTYRLLPLASGMVITIAFITLTCSTYGYLWLSTGASPSPISTLQSLLLIVLAAALFLGKRPARSEA